jgi:hypothetical protein
MPLANMISPQHLLSEANRNYSEGSHALPALSFFLILSASFEEPPNTAGSCQIATCEYTSSLTTDSFLGLENCHRNVSFSPRHQTSKCMNAATKNDNLSVKFL